MIEVFWILKPKGPETKAAFFWIVHFIAFQEKCHLDGQQPITKQEDKLVLKDLRFIDGLGGQEATNYSSC